MEWQPIETAPKDGTVIIGYKKRDDMYDDSPQVFECKYESMWLATGFEFDKWIVIPTHWMPLQEPSV